MSVVNFEPDLIAVIDTDDEAQADAAAAAIKGVDKAAKATTHASHPGKAAFAVRGDRENYAHIGGVQLEDYVKEG